MPYENTTFQNDLKHFMCFYLDDDLQVDLTRKHTIHVMNVVERLIYITNRLILACGSKHVFCCLCLNKNLLVLAVLS